MAASEDELYRVVSGFAVPGPQGFPLSFPPGTLLRATHPLVRTHGQFLERAAEKAVEQATAAPGERRYLNLPAADRHRAAVTPRPTRRGEKMPHRNPVPPGHEDSPASTFASAQPSAGVVADDVPAEQNPAGKPKAADVQAEDEKSG